MDKFNYVGVYRFKELCRITEGKQFPVVYKNNDGETVGIDFCFACGLRYFTVTTVQHNGLVRINSYWEDGQMTQSFK